MSQTRGTGPTHGTIFSEMNPVYAFEPIAKAFPFQKGLCLIIVPYEYEKSSFQIDKWCIGSTTCLISYMSFEWFWPSVSPGLPAGLLKAFWHFLSSSVASCSCQHRGHCFLTNVEQLTSLLHVALVTKVKRTPPVYIGSRYRILLSAQKIVNLSQIFWGMFANCLDN